MALQHLVLFALSAGVVITVMTSWIKDFNLCGLGTETKLRLNVRQFIEKLEA